MTTIIVTGGAGYIGSHTCKALRVAGFVPVSYDNLERGNPEAVQWGDLELGDFADIQRLQEFATSSGCHRTSRCTCLCWRVQR